MIGPDCAAEGPSKGTLDSLMVSLLLARGRRRCDDGGGGGGGSGLAEEHAAVDDDREVSRSGVGGGGFGKGEASHQEGAPKPLYLADELLELEVAPRNAEAQGNLEQGRGRSSIVRQ